MELILPLSESLCLKMGDERSQRTGYPTGTLQKGFLLFESGQNLAEEAVGFGVPLIQIGLQTIFPGSVALRYQRREKTWEIEAVYHLNLIEKLSSRKEKHLEGTLLYQAKNMLAALIRKLPALRSLLTDLSNFLRRMFHWQTVYVESGFDLSLGIHYTVNAETGTIIMQVDPAGLPASIDQVMIMNEQGAHYFDRYKENGSATLQGEEIGCWDEVTVREACFESPSRKVCFSLRPAPGTRLFRGRELVGTRLAWAGFGTSFQPDQREMCLELVVKRLP